ncbi:TMEM165/GDT1 family protein [Zhaonella formicivorans]|uniref:TMEM165/GDT1 family protein n=1 Tax=Zhaonella formicivorans TaxID=2528593 RepID=UPI0010CEA048|nr:TMEM165/GDT1 family protein [Zhaonella formicivorans]
MEAYLASTVFVVLAEMGDKTQLLGMAFATRFKALTVLAGVLVATLANHFIAVALGDYLTNFIPLNYIQFIAALSFIFFGLWTLRGDKLEGEDKKDYFSPFWTVTIAFFIAEMGDKTQLASIALAAKYNSLLWVWMGTTTGMIISNIIGIVVGVVLGKKIPEKAVKLVSGSIFILFGYLGIFGTVSDLLWRIGILGVVTLIVAWYAFYLAKTAKESGKAA